MNFQGKPYARTGVPAANTTYVPGLGTGDLLGCCSHSSCTLVKLQAFIRVQKERVILFAILVTYIGTEILILVTASHRQRCFFQNYVVVSPPEGWPTLKFC